MAWWRDKKYYRLAIWFVLLLLGIYFIYLVKGVLFSFVLAIALAYLLNPIVLAIEQRGTPRIWAILITYLALIIIVTSLILYGMPHFSAQLNRLTEVIPVYAAEVQEISQSIQEEYARAGIPAAVREVIEERIIWLEESLVEMIQGLTESLVGLAGYIFNIILAPILAFYILKDMEMFKDKAVGIIPPNWRDDILELGGEVNEVLNNFIRGFATISLIVGFMVWLAMEILGMEFSLMLGVFAGLTNIIPYFGPVLGALPALTLALMTSKWMALKVLIAFVVIQQVESSLISPKILGDRVGLHPLFVILVLLAGGQLFGLIGVILAVPVSAILRVILKFVMQKILITY